MLLEVGRAPGEPLLGASIVR
ncbi:MAG: hypothetical protein K0S14_1451, partial [Thermomicrobiales bacterium]|nr:hypothetical protein [Thermomicrobiales bacterium]